MDEEPAAEPVREEAEPKKSGQLLGCVFAVFAVGFIFLSLLIFMSSC